MICPSCGQRSWAVDRSVTPDSAPMRKAFSRVEVARVECLVGFYTADYVLRRRTCGGCGKQDHFVELSLDDLEAIYREVLSGGLPRPSL